MLGNQIICARKYLSSWNNSTIARVLQLGKKNTTISAFLLAPGKLTPTANICLLLLAFQNQQVVCICWTRSSCLQPQWAEDLDFKPRDWNSIPTPASDHLYDLLRVYILSSRSHSVLLQHKLLVGSGPLENTKSKAAAWIHTHMFKHFIFISHQKTPILPRLTDLQISA